MRRFCYFGRSRQIRPPFVFNLCLAYQLAVCGPRRGLQRIPWGQDRHRPMKAHQQAHACNTLPSQLVKHSGRLIAHIVCLAAHIRIPLKHPVNFLLAEYPRRQFLKGNSLDSGYLLKRKTVLLVSREIKTIPMYILKAFGPGLSLIEIANICSFTQIS